MNTIQPTADLCKFGTVGGGGGKTDYDAYDQCGYVSEISFHWGQIIDGGSVVLNTAKQGGSTPGFQSSTVTFGGKGGPNTASFSPTPDNRITSVTGTVGSYRGDFVLQSVQVWSSADGENAVLDSTAGAHPSQSGGAAFRFDVPPGYELAGVFGRFGDYTDRFGIVLRQYITVPLALVQQESGQYVAQAGQADNAVGAVFLTPGGGLAFRLDAANAGNTPPGTTLKKILFQAADGTVIGQWPASGGVNLPRHYRVDAVTANGITSIVELRDQQTADFATQDVHQYTVTLEYEGKSYDTDPQIIDRPGG